MLSERLPQEVEEFHPLSATFAGIKIINLIPDCLRFVTQLDLTGNHLLTLNGIEQFANLEALVIDYNLINLPEEFKRVKNKFFMKQLSYIGNPVYWLVKAEDLKEMGFGKLVKINGGKNTIKRQTHLSNSKGISSIKKEVYEEARTQRRVNIRQFYKTILRDDLQETNAVNESRKESSANISTNPNSHQTTHQKYHFKSPQKPTITPFAQVTEEQPSAQSQTATFEKNEEMFDGQRKWAERYLEEEKMRLAGLYHKRTLLQKGFIGIGRISMLDHSHSSQQSILQRMRNTKYSLMRARSEL